MLDPQLLRKDLDAVAARLADRGFTLDTDWYRALEAERKAAQVRAVRGKSSAFDFASSSGEPGEE